MAREAIVGWIMENPEVECAVHLSASLHDGQVEFILVGPNEVEAFAFLEVNDVLVRARDGSDALYVIKPTGALHEL